ncbi:MAG TPA: protein kinase [Ktedonobacteraceae bacterium]|nr:protein kinase [Ktedonobacteraceae bacterium]
MSTAAQRLGKYELRERLGRGGMAEVWKAMDTQLQRYVALKILHADLQNDPNFITRFEREAQVIASLHHPNIVQIHDFQISRPPETSNTIAYMVMDYIEGSTLADYLRVTSRVGKFPPSNEIVYLFTALGRAIDYAHHRGMIHRDIKPANILLDARNTSQTTMGEPILTDFGIVKLLGTSTGTQSGSWMGTPLYIAPEQAQGRPGNERSDIYSLGIILYEICTGTQPFRGDTVPAIIIQHISATPAPPAAINPNIPPALSMVIMRSLAKDPSARYSSAGALADAIADAFNLSAPSEISRPGYMITDTNAPTYLTPANQSRGMTPSPSSQPGIGSLSPVQQVAYATPLLPATNTGSPLSPISASSLPGVPSSSGPSSSPGTTPVNNSGGVSATPNSPQLRTAIPAPVTPLLTNNDFPPPSEPKKRRRTGLLIALIVLLLLLLAGSIASAFLLFPRKAAPTPPVTSNIVGQVQFLSSGRLYVNNNQGLNDELQVDLHNVPAPPAGKAYYAWLLGDAGNDAVTPLLLGNGPLAVQNGLVHYVFPGDAQHSNLLATYSRFLITQEDATNTPSTPTLDYSAWRFAATIPHAPNPADTRFHFSMLDHLRHLLSGEQLTETYGLYGGLGIWLERDTEEVFKWGVNANDHWGSKDAVGVRQQLLNVLYYLDGDTCIVPDLQHVPAGTPIGPENGTIFKIARVPLLDACTLTHPIGFVRHIGAHLQGVTGAPGATKTTQIMASQIDKALNQVQVWLQNARMDTIQLLNTPNDQLVQASSLNTLGDLVTQLRYAYSGHIDPVTGTYTGGVTWIYGSIQRLAILTVTKCNSTTSACV